MASTIEISLDVCEEAVRAIPFSTLEMTLSNGAQVHVEMTPAAGRVTVTLDRVGVLPHPLPLFLHQFGREVGTDRWVVDVETIGAAALVHFLTRQVWIETIWDWVMQNTKGLAAEDPSSLDTPLGPGSETHEVMDKVYEMKVQ